MTTPTTFARQDRTATAATVPTVPLAGRPVSRIGFGALHLAGPGGWGAPADRRASLDLVRAAVDAGVTYIDTADSLGPDVSEAVIAEALHPYRDDLVIATKAGMTRTGPRAWGVLGHPEYLKQQAHASALRLRLDPIPLFYLHRIDPAYPLADQVGALVELREAGVVGAIGLSAVDPDQLTAVEAITPVAAVQNHYNVLSRDSDDVVAATRSRGIPFVAFWALGGHGSTVLADPRVADLAHRTGVAAGVLVLAWLIQRSENLLALPGTGNVDHLLANLRAGELRLDPETVAELDALAVPGTATPDWLTRTARPRA